MGTHGKRNAREKRVKTPSQPAVHKKTGKASKKTCASCGSVLHGVPHGKRVAQVSRMGKSQKSPTGLFGGILCAPCKKRTVENGIKVRLGIKPLEDISLKEKNFVEQAMAYI